LRFAVFVHAWTSIAVSAVPVGRQEEAEAIVLRIANSLFRDESVDETFVQDLRAAGVPEG